MNIAIDDMVVQEIVRSCPNKQMAEHELDALIISIKGKLFNSYTNTYERRADLYERRV